MILWVVRKLVQKAIFPSLKWHMGVCMEPWLGLVNAYATDCNPSYFEFVKEYRTYKVKVFIALTFLK